MSAPSPTWYDLLGVEPTASTEEIRTAWRGAIADLDPTERRFVTLNEAAAVLLDPARRSAYDEELRAAEPEPVETRAEVEPVETPAEAETTSEAETPAAAPVSTSSTSDGSTSDGSTSDGSTSDGSTSEPARAPYLVPGWVLAVVGVVALAMVVLAGVLATRDPAEKIVQAEAKVSSGSKVGDIEERALAAQAAAKEAIVPVLSYNYRTLDADQRKAQGYLTDSYRAQYDKLFGLIKQNAPGTQTVVTTKVVDSGIVRVDQDRVQVLLFVDRPTTNKASSTPIPYQDQVTATMKKVGTDWRVDNLVTTPIQQ